MKRIGDVTGEAVARVLERHEAMIRKLHAKAVAEGRDDDAAWMQARLNEMGEK